MFLVQKGTSRNFLDGANMINPSAQSYETTFNFILTHYRYFNGDLNAKIGEF